MEPLSPAYLSAIAAQTGGLSAFLGGFAATFLGTMLALRAKGRSATLAIGFSAASSVAFIVAVVGSTAVTAAFHPEAPRSVLAGPMLWPQALMTLAFMLGLYALLIALGLSGWARSRSTGLTTSIAAALGIILVSTMIVRLGG